ncbi:MAG: SoxR reducing system RseC family protein [Candidatus Competibacteraceae bacterium]
MIEEPAVVVEAGNGYAWVETRRRSSCGACAASGDCGTAALAKVWGDRRMRVRAVSSLPLRPGDAVIVGLAEGALLRGSLLVYLLPISLLLAGALLGQATFAGAGEEPVVLAGAVGLSLGFLAARVLSRRLRGDARFQPVVMRRLGGNVFPEAMTL